MRRLFPGAGVNRSTAAIRRPGVRRATGALLLAALLLAVICAGAAFAAQKWPNPEKMTFPPLGKIRTPEIQRFVLEENGLVVLMAEDHDFPMVDFRAMAHVGSMYEPDNLRGLAELTGMVLRTGGTTKIPGDSLDARLESLGASIESNIGTNDGTVTGSFLSEDAIAGVGLLADVLRNPAFAEDKIELAKVDVRTEISARNDEPLDIAFREFRKLIYGGDSPYGWYPEYVTVAAITRDDIVAFHRAFFHPNRMILTVSGDFQPAEMQAAIRAAFADWPPATEPLPPDPPVPPEGPQGIYYAEKAGVTQSTVVFGSIGILASDPDYAEMRLLNQVLGEGLTSRLMNEIRTKRGLAYDVGSGPGVGWHHPGTWVAYAMTASESTLVAMKQLKIEIERITREPVTEEELKRAKEIELNQLVFDLATKSDVLNRKALYEFYGYPPDFLERYQERVPQLTAADLLAAAQRHIHPDRLAALVVGYRADFVGSLDELGPVTDIDITIPAPPATFEAPQSTPESLAEGRRSIAAAAQLHNAAKLATFPTLTTEGSGTLSMMGQSIGFNMTAIRVFPDREWSQMTIGGMFKVTTVVDRDRAWQQSPQGFAMLSGEQLESARRDVGRSIFNVLRGWDQMTWQALGPEEFDGVPCHALYVSGTPTEEWRIYIEDENGLIRGMRYRGEGQKGPVEAEERYRDYRPVDGVPIAHELAVLHDGEQILSMKIAAARLGGPIDESIFTPPQQ